MDRSSADDIRMADVGFKATTGLGVDAVNPRVYAQASEECREALAGILNAVEVSLQWPRQIELLIYFLISKPAGGAACHR